MWNPQNAVLTHDKPPLPFCALPAAEVWVDKTLFPLWGAHSLVGGGEGRERGGGGEESEAINSSTKTNVYKTGMRGQLNWHQKRLHKLLSTTKILTERTHLAHPRNKYSKPLLSSTFKVKKRNQDYLLLLVAHAIHTHFLPLLTHFDAFNSLRRWLMCTGTALEHYKVSNHC